MHPNLIGGTPFRPIGPKCAVRTLIAFMKVNLLLRVITPALPLDEIVGIPDTLICAADQSMRHRMRMHRAVHLCLTLFAERHFQHPPVSCCFPRTHLDFRYY